MRIETLRKLREAERTGTPALLATDLESGEESVILGAAGADLPPNLAEAVRDALQSDRSMLIEIDGRSIFLNVFNPPLELIIVGAVHIAQALAPMAEIAGYAVTVIDPRDAFTTGERLPGVKLIHDWPDRILSELKPGPRTAIVTLTHDPKLDDAALIPALASQAFYIGALGSRKTQIARRNRLVRAGKTEDDINRIHGPVGLAIGARAPAEIAVAILAQMTSILHGGSVR